jgi:hypothetical protein
MATVAIDGGLLPRADDEVISSMAAEGKVAVPPLSWLIPLPRTRGPLQTVVTAVRPDSAKHHNQNVTRITDNRLEEGKNSE